MGKRKTEEQIHTEAAAREINKGVSNVVEGSIGFDETARKQTCVINTKDVNNEPDGQTRTIYTSDLFQTFYTAEVKKAVAKIKAAEKRALIKAALEAAKPAEPAKEEKVEIVVADEEAVAA